MTSLDLPERCALALGHGRGALLAPALVAGFALAGLAADPPDRWLVSTTSPVTATGVVDGDDASLLRVSADAPPMDDVTGATWWATAGLRPGDVDAVGLQPGVAPGHRGALAVSLLSNEGGFLDGDVLGLAPGGGLELRVAEGDLAAALGLPDASLDLDALDWDDAGRLCFSLQADLTGTLLGEVRNGDVLRLEPDGTVTRPFAEADVQAALTAATGLTGAVGDVHGLAVTGGDTWVVVQGPSAVDGTALRLGAAPLLAGDEALFGLGGAELDALVALPAAYARGSLAVDQDLASPGAAVAGTGAGFAPGAPVVVVATGGQGGVTDLGLGGFGELALDLFDPVLASPTWPVLQADALGRFQVTLTLPPGLFGGTWQDTWGWTFQALDLATLELTAPLRIQL